MIIPTLSSIESLRRRGHHERRNSKLDHRYKRHYFHGFVQRLTRYNPSATEKTVRVCFFLQLFLSMALVPFLYYYNRKVFVCQK